MSDLLAWKVYADVACSRCPHPAFIHRTRERDGACLGEWNTTTRFYEGCPCPGFETTDERALEKARNRHRTTEGDGA